MYLPTYCFEIYYSVTSWIYNYEWTAWQSREKRPFRHLVLFHNIISPALIVRFLFFKLTWQAVYSLCPLLCFSKHETLCMPQYFAQWYIPVSQNTLSVISFSSALTAAEEFHHRRLVRINLVSIHKQYNAVNTWNSCHEWQCTRCHMHAHIQVRQQGRIYLGGDRGRFPPPSFPKWSPPFLKK